MLCAFVVSDPIAVEHQAITSTLKTDDNVDFRGVVSLGTVRAHGRGGVAVLDNIALPKDQNGLALITGEASVVFSKGLWLFYFNNWVG